MKFKQAGIYATLWIIRDTRIQRLEHGSVCKRLSVAVNGAYPWHEKVLTEAEAVSWIQLFEIIKSLQLLRIHTRLQIERVCT